MWQCGAFEERNVSIAGIARDGARANADGIYPDLNSIRTRSETHDFPTIVQQLADFAAGVDTAQLPDIVVQECKRDILDSLGVALAGIDHPRGRIGVEMGRRIGGTAGDATIIGTGERTTVYGAAFANSELLNALDADSVLLPGPYVLPGAFATAEVHQRSGKDLIAAVAVSHEISYRFGAAMAGYRDTRTASPPTPRLSSATAAAGATASAGKLKHLSATQLANALGLAAASAPVNAQRAWFTHAPTATIKYQLAGGLTNIALTADMGGRAPWRSADPGRRSQRLRELHRHRPLDARADHRRPRQRVALPRLPDVQTLPALSRDARAARPVDRHRHPARPEAR